MLRQIGPFLFWFATARRAGLSMAKTVCETHHYPEIGVPPLGPFGFALTLEEAALDATSRHEVQSEAEKTQPEPGGDIFPWYRAPRELSGADP
jgi:hypothetical protein